MINDAPFVSINVQSFQAISNIIQLKRNLTIGLYRSYSRTMDLNHLKKETVSSTI